MSLQSLLTLAAVLGLLSFFVWLLVPSSSNRKNLDSHGNELIDPNDARQLGTLFGLYGMNIVDVSVARYAISRFESVYGRPPTTLDVGILVGLMREQDNATGS